MHIGHEKKNEERSRRKKTPMRGVTRTSIEVPQPLTTSNNCQLHEKHCREDLAPPSERSSTLKNPLCKQQLHFPGRSDANPVTQEGKRNIYPRALKVVVGPQGVKTKAVRLCPTFLLPSCNQRLYTAKLRPHHGQRVRMRATNHNSTWHCSRVESLESRHAEASSRQVAALKPKPQKHVCYNNLSSPSPCF